MNESPELICSTNDFPMIRTYIVFTGKAKEMKRNKNGISQEIPAEKYEQRTLKTVNAGESFS